MLSKSKRMDERHARFEQAASGFPAVGPSAATNGRLRRLGLLIHRDQLSGGGQLCEVSLRALWSEKLKALWQAPRPEVHQIYGKSIAELEVEWRAVVERADASGTESSVE